MRSSSKIVFKSKAKRKKHRFYFWQDFIKRHSSFLIFVLLSVLLVGFVAIGLVLFNSARAGDNAQLTSGVCSAAPVNSTSFIKTYHLRDTTYGFGVLLAKDGGYLLLGDTIAGGGMAAPYPYIVKTDAKGNKLWSKDFSSQSMALGELSNRHLGRLAIETTDGNIFTAIDVLDFVNEDLKEFYGDVLVTKLNKNGAQIWSTMIGDHSIDRPRQIWALPGGGVLLLSRFLQTGFGSEVTDGVPKYSVFTKIDKNGKVQFSKKMSWDAISAERLADGSFIVLADIAVIESKHAENVLGSEVVPHALPTMIKLDSNLNIVWAKSIEMIPSEINSPSSISSGGFTMGKTTIRLAGGEFKAIQPVSDGGFLAFGFANLLSTQGLYGSINVSNLMFAPRPLIAVKVNAAGEYQWAKKLTPSLVANSGSLDFHVVRTLDGNFIIMQDVFRDSESLDVKKHNASEVLAGASVSNIGLIKTDADFNSIWVKKIDVERDVSGYAIKPTADKGVIISGIMLTTEQHLVMGNLEPYTEAALIKVNVNGEVGGCVSVSNHPTATVEDQSSYLVMQNMSVTGAQDMKLNINKKVKEKVANAKNTARDICGYQKNSVIPVCSYLTSGDYISVPADKSVATPTAKTWAQINYDNTKAVAVDGDKNKTVDDELLPILNLIYNNQVKVKDSMKGMWLTYIFPRPATRADVEAVQKKYEALGYKITDSTGGDLWVSKVGLTLHLTFFIQNSMMGKLEVMF